MTRKSKAVALCCAVIIVAVFWDLLFSVTEARASAKSEMWNNRVHLPRASEVQFALASSLTEKDRARLATIYDGLRKRLIEARIDRRASLAILSEFASGDLDGVKGIGDFVLPDFYSRSYNPSQKRRMADRMRTIYLEYAAVWMPMPDPRADFFIDDDKPSPDDLIAATIRRALFRMKKVEEDLSR